MSSDINIFNEMIDQKREQNMIQSFLFVYWQELSQIQSKDCETQVYESTVRILDINKIYFN